MSNSLNPYQNRELFIKLIKAVGQEIADKAEEYLGNDELLTDLTICISFPYDTAPTIEVQKEHYSKNVYKIYTEEL